RVRAPVDLLQALDLVDVGPGLGELHVLARRAPAVDVLLARVVGGEREPLVVVLHQQMMEVPGAVANVQLRVVQVGEHELRAAGPNRDPLRGGGLQLHEPDRTGARLGIGAELRLLLDHGREECRIEVVVAGVGADDALVAQRVPEPRIPGRLRALQIDECARRDDGERDEPRDAPQDDESLSSTLAAKASRSSSEPSLTYEKSARRTFSSSGMSLDSRAASPGRRASRTSCEAVITTTASKPLSPPVS